MVGNGVRLEVAGPIVFFGYDWDDNMTIQWFPGHMNKARRRMVETLGRIDLVAEIVDARIPLASRNPMLAELTDEKPRLVLLNKSDLADPKVTKEWITYFRDELGLSALAVDAMDPKSVKKIPGVCKALFDKYLKQTGRSFHRARFRILIAGIPNVGKSSLINRLANKKIARTGDRPAVTTTEQWVKIDKAMELLDTPGILWPKFEGDSVGEYLAATGAIRDTVFDLAAISEFAIGILNERYPQGFRERFRLAQELSNPMDILEAIGKKRGCLGSGGVVDVEKACGLFLRELRSGKLGRITLERIPSLDDSCAVE